MVFRYNLLYTAVSRPDTSGLLYPTALNQLFTGLYTLELFTIGLFFLARDSQERLACVGQAVIMTMAMIMTIAFQVLLNYAFTPLLHYVPNGGTTQELREQLPCRIKESGRLRTLLQKVLVWISIRTEFTVPLCELFPDRNFVYPRCHSSSMIAFQHESLRVQTPVVWIPKDILGLSDDEICRVERQYNNIKVSNNYTTLNPQGKVFVMQTSHNFPELESMKV